MGVTGPAGNAGRALGLGFAAVVHELAVGALVQAEEDLLAVAVDVLADAGAGGHDTRMDEAPRGLELKAHAVSLRDTPRNLFRGNWSRGVSRGCGSINSHLQVVRDVLHEPLLRGPAVGAGGGAGRLGIRALGVLDAEGLGALRRQLLRRERGAASAGAVGAGHARGGCAGARLGRDRRELHVGHLLAQGAHATAVRHELERRRLQAARAAGDGRHFRRRVKKQGVATVWPQQGGPRLLMPFDHIVIQRLRVTSCNQG